MKKRLSHQSGWVESYQKNGETKFRSRWWIRDAEVAGGWKKRSKSLAGCSSKKEAKRKHVEHMRLINDQNLRTDLSADADTTFEDFSKGLWEDHLDFKEVRGSTRDTYEAYLRVHLLPTLGKLKIGDIDKTAISNLFRKLRKKGLSPRYRLNIYTFLKTMCKSLVAYEILGRIPVDPALHRPNVPKKEKPVISADQIGAVLREIGEYWRPVFYTDTVLLLRVGELLALRWCDFSEKNSSIRIEKNLYRRKLQDNVKTEKSKVTFLLPDHLKSYLALHKSRSAFNQPEDYIFCKKDGSPACPDYLRNFVLYPAIDRVGIVRTKYEYGFHLLRHSVATIVNREAGLKQTQILLRHANISTTADIYVHVSKEDSRKTMEGVEDKLSKFCPTVAPPEALGSDIVH